jgi:hypothetical protein
MIDDQIMNLIVMALGIRTDSDDTSRIYCIAM